MFNLQGSEIIFILLLALVVLGPEKLPSAIKRFAQTYNELRKMGTGFQTELKSALDEPMREMRETAGLIKQNVDPAKMMADAENDGKKSQIDAERDAERKLRAQEIVEQRKAEQAARSGPTDLTGFDDEPAVDEWADPVDSVDVAPPDATDSDDPSDVAAPTAASTNGVDAQSADTPVDEAPSEPQPGTNGTAVSEIQAERPNDEQPNDEMIAEQPADEEASA